MCIEHFQTAFATISHDNSVTTNNDHLLIIIFLAIIIIYVNNLALMCKAEEKQMEGLSKYLYVKITISA